MKRILTNKWILRLWWRRMNVPPSVISGKKWFPLWVLPFTKKYEYTEEWERFFLTESEKSDII